MSNMLLNIVIEPRQDIQKQLVSEISTMAKEFARQFAPLTGPLTKPDFSQEPTDFVSAARKAAQAAALAATEHSQNNKAYEKLSAPSFPKCGEMNNLV